MKQQAPMFLTEPNQFRERCTELRKQGLSLGFIPTMGALHDGHRRLIEHAERETDRTIVSIFVNPTQFNDTEDFHRYPRLLEQDLQVCKHHGVDTVFAPAAQAMYPEGFQTRIHLSGITAVLEGEHRPGHFDGVCTVVCKLLSLTGSCTLYLGQKDYQQCLVLTQLIADLNLAAECRMVPTVRDPEGLALSSRNSALDRADYQRALSIPQALHMVQRLHQSGERDADALLFSAKEHLHKNIDKIDYFGIFDAQNMTKLSGPVNRRSVLAVACLVGETRLIDNILLGEN